MTIADIENEAILGISAFVLDRLEVSARKLSHLASPVSDILKKHFFRGLYLRDEMGKFLWTFDDKISTRPEEGLLYWFLLFGSG